MRGTPTSNRLEPRTGVKTLSYFAASLRQFRTAGRGLVLLLVVLLAALGGCGGGDDGPDVALDGSPRYPDDEGVLTSVSDEKITLDGERTYAVHERALVFSTYTRAVESLQNRKDQYVQVGLDGNTMEWMAGIARVLPGDPPVVYYVGHLQKVEARRLIFRDGTVLRRPASLTVPVERGPVQVKIDARAGHVLEVVLQ